jgi:hypothetical protein
MDSLQILILPDFYKKLKGLKLAFNKKYAACEISDWI